MIKIEQALHGYANGHQLITSSIELGMEDRSRIDELSDLSGICKENDFTDYYTGYPLLSGNKYVIAKTWYAHEKQRPGCVWTHSLMIDMDDIQEIKNIEKLLSLFHRPSKDDQSLYSNSIDFFSDAVDDIDDYDTEKLKYAVYTIYADEKCKYIYANNKHYEKELLFAITQMPIEILNKFCFCTMSYNIRKIDKKEFDYQIMAKDNIYNLEVNSPNRHVCEDISNIREYPLWVTEYCKYMENGSLRQLNDFIKQYGSDYMNIANYSAMIRLYFATVNSQNLALDKYFEYLEQVLKVQSIELFTKTAELILDEEFLPDVFDNKKELGIWEMFDLGKIKLDKNYKKKLNIQTLKKSPEQANKILQKYIYGKLKKDTKNAVENFILDLAPNYLKKVSNMDENICVVLVTVNEKLMLSKDIWVQKKQFQQTILSVAKNNISEDDLRKLAFVIVECDRENVAENVYDTYGSRIMPYVYEAIQKNIKNDKACIQNWFPILMKDEKQLMHNLNIFFDTKWFLQLFLQIDTFQDNIIYGVEKNEWKEIYDKIGLISNKIDEKCAIQFLPVALKTDYFTNEIYTIIYPIYEQLKNNKMEFNEWNKVQTLLPEVEQCYMWDKCRRIRMALTDRGYDLKYFLKMEGECID